MPNLYNGYFFKIIEVVVRGAKQMHNITIIFFKSKRIQIGLSISGVEVYRSSKNVARRWEGVTYR